MTNGEKIRNMTDSELALFLRKLKNIAIAGDRIGLSTSKLADLEWLQSNTILKDTDD